MSSLITKVYRLITWHYTINDEEILLLTKKAIVFSQLAGLDITLI